MTLTGVKEWICEFLHSPCATPSRYKVLKPFYTTYCFIHKVICNVDDSGAKTKIQSIVISESKCYMKHYLTDVVGKICSTSCNITVIHVETPFKSQLTDNSCRIMDYLNIWIQKASNKAFTQVSCKPLISEEKCFLDWCEIYDNTKFWWSQFYKKWCYLAGCVYQQAMQLNTKTGAIVVVKREPQHETWIRNWISQNLGIQWPRNVSLYHFLLIFCTIGGIGLFILLLFWKKFKSKTESDSIKLKDIDAKFVQMLIDVLEKNKDDYEQLKKGFEEDKLESSQTIQDLNKQNEAFYQQINKLVAEHVTKQEEIQNHASNLEQKCMEYENQIRIMNQNFSDLQREHSIKIEKYVRENRRNRQVQDGLEIEIPRQVKQNEVTKLCENTQQLQHEHNVELNKQEHQKNLQGTLDQLEIDQAYVKANSPTAGTNAEITTEPSQDIPNQCQRTNKKQVEERREDEPGKKRMKKEDKKEEKKNEEKKEEEERTHEDDAYVIESLQTISAIFEQVRKLKVQIDEFTGSQKDKACLHLNELLIRNTLKLDNIESKGHFIIRKKRKEVLDYIYDCRSILKSKPVN